MHNREIELKTLGFVANDDQQCYVLYKYDCNWYVDYWKIRDYPESEWCNLIESIKFDLKESKKEFESNELYVAGKNSAQKEFKKKLKDSYNKYNSYLREAKFQKPDKTVNESKVIVLQAKVELLKELMK